MSATLSDCISFVYLASSTPTSSLTWIAWFCSLPGHEYFCEVTEDFIEDDFNLTGLSAMVPFWKEAMEMVLDVEPGAACHQRSPPTQRD
jgi:casein kinase II subunit beta